MTECITLPQTQFHLILEGDVKKALKVIPDNSIDLMMTSPPYWGKRFYGEGSNTIWDEDGECQHQWNEKNLCNICSAWRGQLGLEPKYEWYIDHLRAIFHEVKRVLKPTGALYLNIGDTYSGSMQGYGATHKSPHGFQDVNDGYFASSAGKPPMADMDLQKKCMVGLPWRVALAMVDDGWILRNDIIWYKPNHMPDSTDDRLTNSYEHIFSFTKETEYYYDLDSIRIAHASVPQPVVASPSLDQIDTTSKYKDLDPLQAGGGKSASANRVTVRKVSREMAKEIYPNDGKKQQEYINFIHDHQSHPLGKNPGDVFSSEEKVVGFNPLAIEEHTIEVSIEEFEDLSTFISTIINQLKNVASTIQLTYSRTNSTTESENFGNFIQEILGTTPMIPNLRIVRGCPYATISIKQTSDKIFIEFGRNRWIFFSRGFVRDNRKTSENLGEVFAVNTQSVTSPFSVLINWFSGFQLPFDIIDKLKIFGSVTNSPTISPVHNTPIRHEQPQDVSGISRNNFEIPFVKCMLSIVQNDVGVAMSTPTFIMESTESSPIIFPSTDNTSLGCSNSRQIYPSIIRLTELEYKGIVPSDMWTLNTKPYKDAHFATFSPEVCEIPIKASCPREVCKKCGKPKIHKVETKIADMEDLPKEQQEAIRRAGSLDGFYEGEATKDYKEANAQNPSDAKRSILESMRRVVVSDSWVATCNCNEGFKEGVVLDIFAGSGTTASVAKSLNRSSISIEINPEYIPLIKKRLDFNQTTLDNIIRYYEKID